MTATAFKAGDLVEVRSREEILATLSPDGTVDGMPFMPEMLRYCGQQLRVSRVAHKICDTAHFAGGRRLHDTVFLENLRCDGAGHGGCEARCLIFWKTHWLKAVASGSRPTPDDPGSPAAQELDRRLVAAASKTTGGEQLYVCQATEHVRASVPLRPLAPWHFIQDVRTGNATVGEVLRAVTLNLVYRLRHLKVGWRVSVKLYERLHWWIMRRPDPFREGVIPEGAPTPEDKLDLRPGELVEVKSHDEILQTITPRLRNRGMAFNSEMTPMCGKQFKVEQRVSKLIEEKSGRMLTMKTPCITLENGYCRALYTHYSLVCSKRVPAFFREIWLKRVASPGGQPLVSIGLPVYNGERFLAQSIESLLGQTYRNIRLFISDNASTDETAAICRRYAAQDDRVVYSRLTENIGGVPNHNRVAAEATGRYFMWASHDDLWRPDYVEKCVAKLESDPGAVVAYTRIGIVDEAGQVLKLMNVEHSADSCRPAERLREFTDPYSILEVMYGLIRIDTLRKTRLMPFHPGSDRLLFGELSLHGRFVQVPEYLYMRRDHDNRSVRVHRHLRERYQWVAPSMAGRRAYPHWAYLRGYAGSVLRAPLRLRERLACALVLVKWVRYCSRELLSDLAPLPKS